MLAHMLNSNRRDMEDTVVPPPTVTTTSNVCGVVDIISSIPAAVDNSTSINSCVDHHHADTTASCHITNNYNDDDDDDDDCSKDESITIPSSIDNTTTTPPIPIPPPTDVITSGSTNEKLINSTYVALSRLRELEELLLGLTKSQVNHLESNINNNTPRTNTNHHNSVDDKASMELFGLTKVFIEKLNYDNLVPLQPQQQQRPLNKNDIYNADDGQSFVDCVNSLYFAQDYNTVNKTVDHAMQSRNVAPIVCEYMHRKGLVLKQLNSSISRLESIRKILLKFNSPKKSNTVSSTSPTKLIPSSNESNVTMTTDSTTTQPSPYRLKVFDTSRKHIIMASLPHQCIDMLNRRMYKNSRKAAFQRRSLNIDIHSYKQFDRIIESIPNGVPFKPMHRSRKRRSFSQLIWITNYNDSLVYNNNTQQHGAAVGGGGNESFYKSEGTLRSRTGRRDYSKLFDVSSEDDDDLLGGDSFDSDTSSSHMSSSQSKRPHHSTTTSRKSYLSRLDNSHGNGNTLNDSKSHHSTNILDNNAATATNKPLQSKGIYDYVILPAELMPVVHIEPIVYNEVVTPVWYVVDESRLDWFKKCITKKLTTTTSNNNLDINDANHNNNTQISMVDDCDEHFNQMHVEYERAERERLIEKSRQDDNNAQAAAMITIDDNTPTSNDHTNNNADDDDDDDDNNSGDDDNDDDDDIVGDPSIKSHRSRNGRFSKLSIAED